MTQEVIYYDGVSKRFGDIIAVDDVSFSVNKGELLALLGPSGSGKTTTLRMLAGFEKVTEGTITLNNKDISTVSPHKRDVSMVFQNYALFPHMTVTQNIKFGLKRKGYGADEIEQRIKDVLAMVSMSEMRDRKPKNLSGGQQQRVATARAIAVEPSVLLMDEPLGALDKKLRDELQIELVNLLNNLNITTLYVTHNQEEALVIADRIAVMNNGQIEQISSPTEIYRDPTTPFVAKFIGDTNTVPPMHDIPGNRSGSVAGDCNPISEVGDGGHPQLNSAAKHFVRPEDIQMISTDQKADFTAQLIGTIEQTHFLGSYVRCQVTTEDSEIIVDLDAESIRQFSEGDEVIIGWNENDVHVTSMEQ